MKRFIVDKNLNVYDTELYGMKTWGSNRQESIVKKRKHYYFRIWQGAAVSTFEASETVYEQRIEVIYETDDIKDIYKLKERLADSLSDVTMTRATFKKEMKLKDGSS